MKITYEIEGSQVVEVVARALYAHVTCPGADYLAVKWPPQNKTQLMTYWNKALAVVKAQHAYVSARESLGPFDAGAKLHSGSSGDALGEMSELPGEDSRAGSSAPEGPSDKWQCQTCESSWRTRDAAIVCCAQLRAAR